MEQSDDAQNLYVLMLGSLSQGISSAIFVFPRQAHGPVPPSRTINLANNLGSSVAIVGPYLYTVSISVQGQVPELVAYLKHATGSPAPVFLRIYPNLHNTLGVAIGR
jgi:hypothetical protein